MHRPRIRILSILVIVAILAIGAGTLARMPTASAGLQARGVKFVLDYRGSLSGTWRRTRPVVLGLTCTGHDFSGSFASSVRPGGKPYMLLLSKEFAHLGRDWRPNQPTGTVTSNRTAQGWLMRYSGGVCRQEPSDESDCGAHRFAGPVYLAPDGGNYKSDRNRAALEWQIEPIVPPHEPTNCSDGLIYQPGRYGAYGAPSATFSMKQLYRCGMRRPRRCRITIGGRSDYPYHKVDQNTTYTSSVHIEWSVTFRAVGRF
jgi:hypothetical protein